MANISVGTALDLLGERYKQTGTHTIQHDCPWCGSRAWASRWNSQCYNHACSAQAYDGLDILTKRLGIVKAGEVLREYDGKDHMGDLSTRAVQRKVMDAWIGIARQEPAINERTIWRRIIKQGGTPPTTSLSCAPLGLKRMRKLLTLAEATGASLPPGWDSTHLPGDGLAYIVQSTPHTIDRIVVSVNGSESSIKWSDFPIGVTGLIGMIPGEVRPMVGSFLAATRANKLLRQRGENLEVASVSVLKRAKPTVPCPWYPGTKVLAAVAESPDDVITMQRLFDAVPALENCVAASTVVHPGYAYDMRVKWEHVRKGTLLRYANIGTSALHQTAVTLFEQTGSKRDDAAFLISALERKGKHKLADEMRRIAACRVIVEEARIIVREEAAEYTAITHRGIERIANFAVDVVGGVSFADHSVFHLCDIRSGALKRQVMLSGDSLLQPKTLQDQLQVQFSKGMGTDGITLPTVIDHTAMRRFVLPHIRKSIATSVTERGVSELGWSPDRQYFSAPGLTVDGEVKTNAGMLHPLLPVMANFKKVENWHTDPIKPVKTLNCVILAILAQIVRTYKHLPTKHLAIRHDSGTFDAVKELLTGTGQLQPMTVTMNFRDNSNVRGCYGYPLLVSNLPVTNAQVTASMIYPDADGVPVDDATPDDIDAAKRYLQYAISEVANWCVTTHAVDFKEEVSTSDSVALVCEGSRIANTVLAFSEPADITRHAALEGLLAQLPLPQIRRRLRMFDDMSVSIDISGCDVNEAQLVSEMRSVGSELTIDNNTLKVSATAMLPALTSYYGRDPMLTPTA